MQPRSDLYPFDETVFHVTKRGCSSSFSGAAGEGCCERRLPKEKNEVLDEDLDASPKAARDEVVDSDEGVEEDDPEAGDGTCKRLMLGSCRLPRAGFGATISSSSSSSSTFSSIPFITPSSSS